MLPLRLYDGADDNNILGIDVDSPSACLLLTERGVYVNIIKCGYCTGTRNYLHVDDVDDFLRKNKGLFSRMANSRQTFKCTFTEKPKRFAIHMKGNLDRKSQGDIFFEFESLKPTPFHKAQAKKIIDGAFDELRRNSSLVADPPLDLTDHRIPDEYLPPIPMSILNRCGSKLSHEELLKRANEIRENDRARKRESKLLKRGQQRPPTDLDDTLDPHDMARRREDRLKNFDQREKDAIEVLDLFKRESAAAQTLSSSYGGGSAAAAAAVSSFSSGAGAYLHAGAKGYSSSGVPSSYGVGAEGYSSYGGGGRSAAAGTYLHAGAKGYSSSVAPSFYGMRVVGGSSSFGGGGGGSAAAYSISEMTNHRANQLYEKQQKQAAARQQAAPPATVGDSHDDRDLPIVPRNYHYANPYSPDSDEWYIRESSGDGV
jgi:hypothetical protein